MATVKKTAVEKKIATEDSVLPRGRMHTLTFGNFRAIGEQCVEIEINEIVVLVGANNTGKSSSCAPTSS